VKSLHSGLFYHQVPTKARFFRAIGEIAPQLRPCAIVPKSEFINSPHFPDHFFNAIPPPHLQPSSNLLQDERVVREDLGGVIVGVITKVISTNGVIGN